jgi:outer membrane protein insertion porin family
MPDMALRPVLLMAGVAAIAAAADLSPRSEYEGKPLGQVRFEPQSQPVARSELARIFPLQPGSVLHLEEIGAAIKRLFATGEYANVEVEAVPSGDSVDLVVRTTEQYFVGPVEVRGDVSLPPNEGQLANATRLELGRPYEDDDLADALAGIRDLFERNGLYLSQVEPDVSRDAEHQQIGLTFRVDAGHRARLSLPQILGDPKLPAAEVAKAAKYKGWFRWRPATESATQSGLENIRSKYAKEDRLTANVTLDHVEFQPDQRRLLPFIRVEGGPEIDITTTGAKVSRSDLRRYVPVFYEQTVNRDLLVRGVRNLRDYFQNKGYFEVQVDFRDEDAGPDKRNIVFEVTPGERHKLVEINVQGNRYFSTEQIRERMFLTPAGFIRLRHGRYSDSFARRDEDAIEALYRDNGYRDARVTIETIDAKQGKPGEVAATVTIDEGPQYLISALEVNGVTRPDRDSVLARLSSNPGQPYSDTTVATDRDYILNLYQSTGYPDAAFESHIYPADEPNRVRVQYLVNEGSPRFVRDVVISGLRGTNQRLIQPNILLKPGDPLSWTEMGRMQRRLYNLGIFDKVDMAIQNPDGEIPSKYVLYNLTEGHRYYVAFGAGGEIARIGGAADSLDSPAGATGFAPRASLELSRLNFLGLGHSINFKSRYSRFSRRVSLSYLAPRYRNVEGRNISFTALYDNTRDVLTFTARRLEGAVQLSQQISRPTTVLWRYFWRDVRVDQNTLKIDPLLIPLLSAPARVAGFGANVVQDRRDDPVDAHRGIYNTGDLQVVERAFGGNRNYLRFLGRNSYYKSLGRDLVLASNTQFGWIKPFRLGGEGSNQYIPIAERFYGGGSTSHRGFPDNQAGPRDLVTGFPSGGNALLFHSTELRFPLIGDNISGVLFHDFGNVYSDLRNISFRLRQRDITDFDYTVHGAGFGIRYRTPVGPVRVDLAYSFNPPTFNGLEGTYRDLLEGTAIPKVQTAKHFQFFISIGQAF